MPIRDERWPAGTPCWVDLSTPDVEAAKSFYGAVLGWDFREADGGYWLCLSGGREAAGMMAVQSPEQPPAWTTYFATDDADSAAKQIVDAGGTVLMGPETVGPYGRMAYVKDPTGAAFGLWQADQMIGVQVYNEPGALTWEDAQVPDTAAAQEFYARVFHVAFEAMPGGFDYATFALPGGDPLGGLGALMAPDDPPSWRPYFAVADTDLAVAAALGEGGHVVEAATDTPYGRMARLTDPAGAAFTLMGVPPPA